MLITVPDLATYMQSSFAADKAMQSAEAAVAMASEQVETHCRRRFELVTDDVITLRWRPSIVLPDPPVVEITAFQVDGVDSEYDIDDSGRYWPANQGDQISVTYTHGFTAIPQPVRLVALRIASRIMRNPQMRSSYTGPDGLNYASPSDVGPRVLSTDEATLLRRWTLYRAI